MDRGHSREDDGGEGALGDFVIVESFIDISLPAKIAVSGSSPLEVNLCFDWGSTWFVESKNVILS